jgi:hypothetical protein
MGIIGIKVTSSSQTLGIIVILTTVIIGIFLCFKFSFYFPAKAVNNSISLKQSYHMTKGYLWKIIGASFFAIWRILLVIYAFLFATLFIMMGLSTIINNEVIINTIGSILAVSVVIYFYPITYALGITVLSNYYQHALQNKPDYNDQS